MASQLIRPEPGSLHYTAHRSNSRGNTSKFWVKEEGYVQKWHLWYKTSDISETKQSRAKVTTLYSLSIADKSGDLGWTFAYFSGEQNF